MFTSRAVFASLIAVSALVGCKNRPDARYVFRSSDMGIIAMPADTPENRERATALMRSHFPEGYEVVCEGEEAYRTPTPPPHVPGDAYIAQRLGGNNALAAANWNEPAFQQQIEQLPGTPQAMRGYSQPPVPSVGVTVGDPPAPGTGVIRSEWRITYRRRDDGANSDGPQSLFPEYQAGND